MDESSARPLVNPSNARGLYLHLLQRIHRRYPTVTQPIRAGGLELSFTRVADPDRVLDDVVEEETRRQASPLPARVQPPRMPYWAEVWDSAYGVGQAMARDRNTALAVAGKSVLDLGCGMGLAGLFAAALGARVLMVDLESPALLFARLNTLPWRQRVAVRRTNWQTDRLAQTFDRIVGADILYERSQWDFLEAFSRRHLSPGGTVLLGEPGRQTGDLFTDWITLGGWKVTQSVESVPTRLTPIRLFHLTRPSGK